MAEDENNVVAVVTRGFSAIQDQLRERDTKVSLLSEKVVGIEIKIDQLKETLTKVEADMSKAETERIKIRVDNLEEANKDIKTKQSENAKWIKGLVGSVVILLIGFILNLLWTRIQLK